ncbi:MAG: hypothetical protein QOE63_557 [Acidimicrobiaceae bacterium]|jgi:hypothetical protein
MTSPAPSTGPIVESRQKTIIRRSIITGIVLLCIGGLVVAAQHTRRGDEKIDLTGGNTTVVELLTPPDGSTLVNQQAQVGIDLTADYGANLQLNGVLIPENQLERHPELNSVYFRPGPDQIIKVLPAGRNTVTAILFRVDGTPTSTPSITWTFNVS